MDIVQAVAKLRLFLADAHSRIWQDDELSDFITQALQQYSIDCNIVSGTFDLIPDKNGKYFYPDNFAAFIIGWNSDSREIRSATAQELFETRCLNVNKKGQALYIYDNCSEPGAFSLAPVPPDNQNMIDWTVDGVWGDVALPSFGVIADNNWGVTTSIFEYDFAGDCVYSRVAAIEEVQDYMAVIYYAMYLAYSVDSERANDQQAIFALSCYKQRTAAYNEAQKQNSGKLPGARYY